MYPLWLALGIDGVELDKTHSTTNISMQILNVGREQVSKTSRTIGLMTKMPTAKNEKQRLLLLEVQHYLLSQVLSEVHTMIENRESLPLPIPMCLANDPRLRGKQVWNVAPVELILLGDWVELVKWTLTPMSPHSHHFCRRCDVCTCPDFAIPRHGRPRDWQECKQHMSDHHRIRKEDPETRVRIRGWERLCVCVCVYAGREKERKEGEEDRVCQ